MVSERRSVEATMTSVVASPSGQSPLTDVCGRCGFTSCDRPAQLARTLQRAAVGYQRVVVAFATATEAPCGPSDEVRQWVLNQVIHVRDALHSCATCLTRMTDVDTPVFDELDPEPIQPYAPDYTWAATVGLAANLDHLAGVIDHFPADRWEHRGVLDGRALRALELTNCAVHETIHHLFDIERLARPPKMGRGA